MAGLQAAKEEATTMNATAEATKTTEAATVAGQPANSMLEQGALPKGGGKKGAKAVAKKKVKSSSKPAPKKDAKSGGKKASDKRAKPAGKTDSRPTQGQPHEGSKKQIVLDLLRRKDGATMAEIATATGWQKHTIRGFISGTLIKKMDLPVASLKNEAGDRIYRIEK